MNMNDERMTIIPKEEWLDLTEKARDYNALEIRNAKLQCEIKAQHKVILFYRVLVITLIIGFAIINLKL